VRVGAIADRPLAELPYLNAARGGGVERAVLPVLDVTVDACAHLLDGEVRALDGLRVGGVSGIVGALERHDQRPSEAFVALMGRLVALPIGVLLLHEAPTGTTSERPGNATIRSVIEEEAGDVRPLVLCGHTPWASPLAELANGVQVLNLEARVAVLRARR
jgi:hypothetical protein